MTNDISECPIPSTLLDSVRNITRNPNDYYLGTMILDTIKQVVETLVRAREYDDTPEIPLNGKICDNAEHKKPNIDPHSTMDADVWASEFCKTYKKLYKREIDEEWMHTWFANAIMCGWDHQSWKRDKEYIYILKTSHGDILKVFHWEPNEKEIREEYEKYYTETIGSLYHIWDYIRLFRWSKIYGMTEMNGPKTDSYYEWKAVNQ